MFQKSVLVLTLALSVNAFAVNNDFGSTDSAPKTLSAEELRNRFQLDGAVYIADQSGKLLYQGGETRSWKFGAKGPIESNWSFTAPGMKEIALAHEWSVDDQGRIFARIREFDTMKGRKENSEVEYGKLLREEKIEIKDFAPVNWTIKQDGGSVVVRLSPSLADANKPMDVTGLDLTLEKPVVYDNKGRLWAAGGGMSGTYLHMTTHMGTFAISFKQFQGSKEIGTARGNEIELKDGELKLAIRSLETIVAGNRPVKVYGLINTSRKTERLNSVRSGSSDNEQSFLKRNSL